LRARWAIGIAACLLEDTGDYEAILDIGSAETKTALFACASPALADEVRSVQTETNVQVQTNVSAHPDELVPAFTPSFATSRAGAVVDRPVEPGLPVRP